MAYFVVFTRESGSDNIRKKFGRKVYQDTPAKARAAVNRLWGFKKVRIISAKKATNSTPAIVDY